MLLLLMWKHALVRKRCIMTTFAEMLYLLVWFLLLFAIEKYNNSKTKSGPGEINSGANTDIMLIDEIEPAPYRIMYAPKTLLTDTIMVDVGAELKLPKLDSGADRSTKGYSPLTRLADFATDMQITEAVIMFKVHVAIRQVGLDHTTEPRPHDRDITNMDFEKESLPAKLNYSIRMLNAFHTETYESLDENSGPHANFGFEYGTFMRIQWAIDISFIRRIAGDVPLKLSLQEFPYHHLDTKVSARVSKILGTVCWMSLFLNFLLLTGRLLQERTTGVQELMQISGVSPNTLGLSHFLNVLPCGLIFAIGATIILKVTDSPLVPKTNAVLIGLMLFLYFNSVISLAYVCGYISKRPDHVEALAVLVYVIAALPALLLKEIKLSYLVRLLAGFLPHMPMESFWHEVFTQEAYGMGANFGNITKAHGPKNVSAAVSLLFLLLHSVFYYFLAWYLSLVRPGPYGQALPWYIFPIPYLEKRQATARTTEEHAEEEESITIDPQYFEPGPARTEVGIEIVNVSKVYPKLRVLKHVSMKVYKGEITVLIGRNGAGKSTLMSIITGMTSATEGKVFVNGKDTVTQKKEVRKNISLCPQYNILIENLTVQEHIIFFTLLKHGSFAEARISSGKLAEKLGLTEKLGTVPSKLSGGMKRRAQLACALAGGADVLVLDEPTSGLDVETRREMWDLLLSLRGDRTVLLSTHFMEEADALGDRVAALHAGVLRCFASTMHLKKVMGTGYRLSFTTIGLPNEAAISKVVMSHVPDAMVKEQTINSLSYNLPAMHSGKFPGLFAALEAKRSELGLVTIGVGVSKLEEVFLKLCSDVNTSMYEDEEDNARASELPTKKLTGIPLYIRQFAVLFKRQLNYGQHQKTIFLMMFFVFPTAIIFLMTKQVNEKEEPPQPAVAMDLNMYGSREDNRVLYHVEGKYASQAAIDKLRAQYPKVTFEKADDVATKILSIGQADLWKYNKYLVGVEIKHDNAKILYTTTVRHAAPVALNLLSKLLHAHHRPTMYGITTMNDPISKNQIMYEESKQPKALPQLAFWGTVISAITLMTNSDSFSLPCKERQTGSRHIHIMSGCPAELHWLATLSFHITIWAAGVVLPIVIAALVMEEDDTINQTDLLGTIVVVLLLGSLAFFASGYIVTLNCSEGSTTVILMLNVCIFGILTPIVGIFFEALGITSGKTYYFLSALFYIATPHTMTTTVLKCLHVGYFNAWCNILKKNCPNLIIDEAGFDSAKCCAGKNPRCYFCIDKYSPGKGMIILFVQFLVQMTIVFLIERGIFNGLVDQVMNLRYKPEQHADQDKMVRAEKAYVSRAIKMPVKEIPDSMLLDDVHKNYVQLCKKNINAVKGVSFSVKKGECFGLLGVNGAGKSTCFKMITGEVSQTRGKIFSNGYFLRRGNIQYLQTLGYCPQFFGLDMFQTGEQNLTMVLTLRGYDRQRVDEEVKNWINIVGLEKYASQLVEEYSGGCMRRLSAAAALCVSTDLALLDEPTTGVDVAARRKLWTAMRRALRLQRAVVITSHSMDEMEALCARIAIMSGGRVRALGSAAGLRAAHASGYAIVFKFVQQENEVVGATEKNRLKRAVQETFKCTLTDEHNTMLHYHINETMQYSDLFSKLESLRDEFSSFIEDYSVTETTLEEVFLSLAKEQEQQQGPHAV